MPYKKKYIKRRYIRGTKLKKLERTVKRVSAIVNTREKKWVDLAAVGASATWSGTIGNLISPVQGVQDFQRVGDKIAVERVEFRMNGGMSTAGSNLLRVIIFRDMANGIGTTVSNVLHSGTLGTANASMSWYNTDQRDNIEVYYDRMIRLDSTTNYQFLINFKKSFKKPKILELDSGSTTVTKGQFKFLVVGTAAVANFAYNYNVRVQYSDL